MNPFNSLKWTKPYIFNKSKNTNNERNFFFFNKSIKEYQEEQKKISSEIETLKDLKQEEESTIENYKLLEEKVNEFLEFKELNSLIVHSLISRIEVGYRDNPRTIRIYYKFIDTTL